ncbi:hypothetical protein FRC16_009888 [Serendipita sp. 398]|nr:hypothetical protein FRC16_009888 [Serendipita sp. 398]
MSISPKVAPPLKGDSDGIYRIVVHGNSGTGKTTLSNSLGQILGVPVFHLDEIHWRPNWVEATSEEMKTELTKLVEQAEVTRSGWIVDGNYESKTGGMMDGYATDIIWLDPPFWEYFPRSLWRTFRRLLRLDKPCAPGCQETFKECFFSSNSIILWVITNHRKARRRYEPRWAADQTSEGGSGRWKRLGDVGEQTRWISEVSQYFKSL